MMTLSLLLILCFFVIYLCGIAVADWDVLAFVMSAQGSLFLAKDREAYGHNWSSWQLRGFKGLIVFAFVLWPLVLPFYMVVNSLSIRHFPFFLQHPFALPELEMSWYDGARSFSQCGSNEVEALHDKMYWHGLFEEHKVPTPKLYALVENGQIVMGALPTSAHTAIVKPVVGGGGRSVQLLTDLVDLPQELSLVQERITPRPNNGHYRIVTVRRRSGVRHMWTYFVHQPDRSRVATNRHSGGTAQRLDPTNAPRAILAAVENAVMLHLCMDICGVTAVGWDVVLDGPQYYFLEGNVPAGLVFKEDPDYVEIAKTLLTAR